MRLWFQLPCSPGEGAGAGAGAGDGGERKYSREEVKAQVERYLRKHRGSAQAALDALFGEQAEYREEIRVLKLENTELKSKVKDGVVITTEESKDWDAYRALGKPGELKKQVEEGTKAAAELAIKATEDVQREAAGIVGYNFEVLRDQVRLRDLTVEMRDAEVVGQDGRTKEKKRLPYVRAAKDEKDKGKLLTEYAESELKPYLLALKAPASTDKGGGSQGDSNVGRRFPSQGGSSARGGETDIKDAAEKVGERFLTPSQRKAAKA